MKLLALLFCKISFTRFQSRLFKCCSGPQNFSLSQCNLLWSDLVLDVVGGHREILGFSMFLHSRAVHNSHPVLTVSTVSAGEKGQLYSLLTGILSCVVLHFVAL